MPTRNYSLLPPSAKRGQRYLISSDHCSRILETHAVSLCCLLPNALGQGHDRSSSPCAGVRHGYLALRRTNWPDIPARLFRTEYSIGEKLDNNARASEPIEMDSATSLSTANRCLIIRTPNYVARAHKGGHGVYRKGDRGLTRSSERTMWTHV